MKQASDSIPMRTTAAGPQMEIRPLYVEEWLDSLPYIDFAKTSHLLNEATRATNQAEVKPSVRLELVQLYNRPYQYYVDSQIRAGAQHTLQTIETMQAQIDVLKQIAVNLASACKLAVEQTLNRKTIWRQSKPPLPAMLMSLNYLSHALIFSFLEYSPIPKNVWQELNFILDFAEDLGQENTTILPLGGKTKQDATSIANAYKRISLASLVDPHHLPFGAVWEIFNQLRDWSEYVQLGKFQTLNSPFGCFVVDLKSDSRPIPYAKFDNKTAGTNLRLLDAGNLGNLVQKHLDLLNMGHELDASVRLSPYFAKTILNKMSESWGHPPVRHFPRETRQGSLNLCCGLNVIYFYTNDEREFVSQQSAEEEDMLNDLNGYMASAETTAVPNYKTETWGLVNQGPGGFSVIKNDKPGSFVRVGDLVGISHGSDNTDTQTRWALGIIRWLMIQQSNIYKIGIQTISVDIIPVAVRAISGSLQDRLFRRAFVAGDLIIPGDNIIITSNGLYSDERELEIRYGEQIFNAKTVSLEESSVNFEHFTVITG